MQATCFGTLEALGVTAPRSAGEEARDEAADSGAGPAFRKDSMACAGVPAKRGPEDDLGRPSSRSRRLDELLTQAYALVLRFNERLRNEELETMPPSSKIGSITLPDSPKLLSTRVPLESS